MASPFQHHCAVLQAGSETGQIIYGTLYYAAREALKKGELER